MGSAGYLVIRYHVISVARFVQIINATVALQLQVQGHTSVY